MSKGKFEADRGKGRSPVPGAASEQRAVSGMERTSVQSEGGRFEAPSVQSEGGRFEAASVQSGGGRFEAGRKRSEGGRFEAGRGRSVTGPRAQEPVVSKPYQTPIPGKTVHASVPDRTPPAAPVKTASGPKATVPMTGTVTKAPVTKNTTPSAAPTAPAAKAAAPAAPTAPAVKTTAPSAAPKAPETVGDSAGAQAPKRRRWPLALGLGLLVAVLGLGLAWLLWERYPPPGPTAMSREDLLAHYRSLADTLLKEDLVLTLHADTAPDQKELDIVLTVPPAKTGAWVDLTKLEMDLTDGVGRVGKDLYEMDPTAYVSLDREALRQIAQEAADQYNREYRPSGVRQEEEAPPAETEEAETGTEAELVSQESEDEAHEAEPEPGGAETGEAPETSEPGPELQGVQYLILDRGSIHRSLDPEAIYECLLASLYAGTMRPALSYEYQAPEPLNLDAIWDEYCTAPVDAVLNRETFEITPERPGYGFNRRNAATQLLLADEGSMIRLRMGPLPAATTAKTLEDKLYSNILGEAHTPHTWDDSRTTNLRLACEAIDGTVLMPGDSFSFNETVGERTWAKGYREATAYVGNESVPEIGGGVCQVASSIYYAVLQADLETLERHEHTFLVTYVPQGMDAAIYWGLLDYKFRNSSLYPVKIEASVNGGQVHIVLRGMEWKDYTVKLSFEVLSTTPWETVEQYVYDGSYQDGEVITTPYTGARVATYKTLYDKDGSKLDTEQIAVSTYRKRDKVIAVVPAVPPSQPAAPEPEPDPEPWAPEPGM